MAKAKKGQIEETPVIGQAPEGFESFDLGGDYGTTVDFEKTPTISGELLKIDTVEIKKGKESRVITIQTDDGKIAVWESVKLRDLFDAIEAGKVSTGTILMIQFVGIVKVKGRKAGMKDFKVYMKAGKPKK